MAELKGIQTPEPHSAAGFIAAAVSVFIGTVAAWMSFPYAALYVLFVPIIVVDVIAAAVLITRPGTAGQIGRGLLIGLISVPLSAPVIWGCYLIGS
ncbi:hypothetical protein [Mycobacterium sp. URHB0044]|jgi:hypothetical protein|uniref:hypothetical protein n=1 Tax=Mycobacterium sp. URHB0044 TaxID=1380386 RepID=UPI0006880591|nr:hypothetical protein [Mycobacterium sp. URHB0044]